MYVTRLTKNLFCKCTLSRLVVVVGGERLGIRIKEKQDSTRLAKKKFDDKNDDRNDDKNFVLEFRN